MGAPSVGDVVLILFPYSDLSKSKRRPALVLADVGIGDYVLCQITSKPYADTKAVPLSDKDFAHGSLSRESYIRIGKLFTANEAIILGAAGTLKSSKLTEVVTALVNLLLTSLR